MCQTFCLWSNLDYAYCMYLGIYVVDHFISVFPVLRKQAAFSLIEHYNEKFTSLTKN